MPLTSCDLCVFKVQKVRDRWRGTSSSIPGEDACHAMCVHSKVMSYILHLYIKKSLSMSVRSKVMEFQSFPNQELWLVHSCFNKLLVNSQWWSLTVPIIMLSILFSVEVHSTFLRVDGGRRERGWKEASNCLRRQGVFSSALTVQNAFGWWRGCLQPLPKTNCISTAFIAGLSVASRVSHNMFELWNEKL